MIVLLSSEIVYRIFRLQIIRESSAYPRSASMESSKRSKTEKINKLPIKIVLTKEDLEDDDKILLDGSVSKEKQASSKNATPASTIEVVIGDYGSNSHVTPTSSKTQMKALTGKPSTSLKLGEKPVLKLHTVGDISNYGEGKRSRKRQRREEASKTKGDKWFNLPATEMTDELLRDYDVVRMRSILSSKQFYKKNETTAPPKYFQVGTVVDSSEDFYSGRIPRKERKKTLVDQLMADANFQRYNKRKYAEIIQGKQPTGGGSKQQKKRSRPKKK